jgi:nitrogen fixation protein FixH
MIIDGTPRRAWSQSSFVQIGAGALLVLVLAVAGCSKPRPAAPVQSSATPASGASTSGWKLNLKVEPDHPRMVRPAKFAVLITDSNGKPVENAQVIGTLNMTLMDMGKAEVKFDPKGSGEYDSVKSFDMSGPWELSVDAEQGALRAHKVFQVTVLD